MDKIIDINSHKKVRAAHVKQVWLSRRNALNLRQIEVAEALGITQASLSQYLNGVIPLNTDFLLAFAKILKVSPTELDQSLGPRLKGDTVQKTTATRVPILGNISGQKLTHGAHITVQLETTVDAQYYGITVDTEQYQQMSMFKNGSYVLVNPLALLRTGDFVALRRMHEEHFQLFQLQTITTDHVELLALTPGQSPVVIELGQVACLHKVIQCVLP